MSGSSRVGLAAPRTVEEESRGWSSAVLTLSLDRGSRGDSAVQRKTDPGLRNEAATLSGGDGACGVGVGDGVVVVGGGCGGVLNLTDISVAVKLTGWQLRGNTAAQPVVKMEPSTGENIPDWNWNWNDLGICSTLGKVILSRWALGNLSLAPDKSRQIASELTFSNFKKCRKIFFLI